MKYRYYEVLSPTIRIKMEVSLSQIIERVKDPALNEEQNLSKAMEYLASKNAERFSDLSFNEFQDSHITKEPIDVLDMLQDIYLYKDDIQDFCTFNEDLTNIGADDKKAISRSLYKVLKGAAQISNALGLRLTDICDKKEQ